MGFRLYVGTCINDANDSCFGKLYGYNYTNTEKGKLEETHLYSLDYLISIDAFKDWDDAKLYKDNYNDMSEYFSFCQSTDAIKLSIIQFNRFMSLYLSDQALNWNYEYPINDSFAGLNKIVNYAKRKGVKTISIYWC